MNIEFVDYKETPHARVREEFVRLQEKHGLQAWSLDISSRYTSRFGACDYDKQTVIIAEWLVKKNVEQALNTVRHEIAHVLTGPGHGHDALWKKMCVKVGAEPVRCGPRKVWQNSPSGKRGPKWIVECVNGCFKTTRKRRRKNTVCKCGGRLKWTQLR